ncbi:TniQ family protein [Candidatus Methylobacter oryzae]|uniref:MerR family transcriptional regulator n=1 Tax=Candidatus Methylobacter oryzae TaxID=2497749 RepID=A0ABY3CCD0_9GAMM|nr:TniQ family protein [Candidatus Methylobacter oryzae]TRW98575.1 MerR family transcriptional regulator [Candidatus Methylobacter oryzae]
MMIADADRYSLPVRPRPIHGEATLGFLMRVARANGYETIRQLRKVFRTFDAVCQGLDLSVTERRALFGPYPSYWGQNDFKHGLTASDFNYSLMRWCPYCLRESAHLRGLWLLKVNSVCCRHAIRLVDRCTSCDNVQRLERVNFEQCDCGTWLADSQGVEKVHSFVVRVSGTVEASIEKRTALSGLPPLSLSEWLRLISYLGQFSETFQPAKPGKIANLYQVDTAIHLFSQASRLLDKWPENFYTLLAALHRQADSQLSIRKTFGSLYRVLYTDLSGACFQFLRDEFEHYLHQYWFGVVGKRNRAFKPETIVSHPRVTLKQAAKKTGVAQATVRQLIQAELISGGRIDLPSGRKALSVHENSLEEISFLAKGCVTLGEASRLLCLPECRVRELISYGIIKPLVSRAHGNAATWLIPKQQVKQLFFTGRASSHLSSTIIVKQLLKYWHLRDGEFKELVQALSEGQLVAVAFQSVALGNVTLNEQETRQWLVEKRYAAGLSLSVDEAAKRLGLKQQVVYDLVKLELLATIQDNLPGRRVTRESLDDFQVTYISLAEYSRSLNRAPRWVLKTLDVQPITGPIIDGSRQYFFRRSDVYIDME